MKKFVIISVLAFASGSVLADESKLAQLDKDNDGRISVEEAASDPAVSAIFAELDTNKDGYLTPSELAEH